MDDLIEALDSNEGGEDYLLSVPEGQEFLVLKAPKGLLGKYAQTYRWLRDDEFMRAFLPHFLAYGAAEDADGFLYGGYQVEPPDGLIILTKHWLGF